MPTFNVRLDINVPGVGLRTVDQVGIVAADMATAIALAKDNIKVEPVHVIRTASTP